MWEGEIIWSTWIIQARYITVLSYGQAFSQVLEAVKEKANDIGGYVKDMPIVLLSAQYIGHRDADALRETLDEGSDLTFIME
jgi:hypothetical protein